MATISPGWIIFLSYISCLSSYTLGQTFCQSSWCLEGSECVLTGTTSKCLCISGYTNGVWNLTEKPYTFTCSDIDECSSSVNQCKTNATCENTKGSYQCICPQGKKLWVDPLNDQHCLDMGTDICESSISVCGIGTGCSSTPTGTSYACTCLAGYTGQNFSLSTFSIRCYDVDECTADVGLCGEFATCINQIGSYRCRCDLGITSWSGPQGTNACSNGDICNTNLHICGRGSNCVSNLIGGRYDCTCAEGYSDLTFINANKTLQCSDTNECSSNSLNSCDRALSACVNIVGSFTCECITGYDHSQGNNRLCEDVNECLNSTARVCPDSTVCVNTPGSYRCPCQDGFVLSSSGNPCQSQSNVEIAVGLSVSAVISLVIIVLLIVWCARDKFKRSTPPEKKLNRRDQDSVSLRSDHSSFAMTPSALLSVSSRSGSVRFQKLQPNGIIKNSNSNGVYHVHTITERMVRSYRRKKLSQKSQASSYLSRTSSNGSQMSKPSYFDTRSNGLAAIRGSNESEISDHQENQPVVNGKGKGVKGVKQKGNPGGMTISANKLPEDVMVTVESAIVTPVDKVFSPDDEISTQGDADFPAQPSTNNLMKSSSETGQQVPSFVITAAEPEPVASSITNDYENICLPQSILKKNGSNGAKSTTSQNNDIPQPMAHTENPLAVPVGDEDLYSHVKPKRDRLNEHNQKGIIPRVKSFRSALKTEGEPEISQLLSEDSPEDKAVLNVSYQSDDD